MYKIFVDANIIVDIFDDNRSYHKFSKAFLNFSIEHDIFLYTSCDLITTIYYIESKVDRTLALKKIENINKTLTLIEFSNHEVQMSCNLMSDDSDYKDLEDTISYILAKKVGCDLIVSNDKNFVAKDIKILTSEKFCREYIKGDEIL